jgi:hypothetical protein
MKKQYISPQTFVVACCTTRMLASSWRDDQGWVGFDKNNVSAEEAE